VYDDISHAILLLSRATQQWIYKKQYKIKASK